uniref:Phorbol-ester/DAG-type domain-containing protein n=1 Tax=Anopheles melas TaxID=34690 RepID=A0A182TLV0_9DIPT
MLYAGEGEARRPDEQQPSDIGSSRSDEKPLTMQYKGHEFLQISYHIPTTCDLPSCQKTLWHVFKSLPAYECKRCRFKLHKEHVDNNNPLAPCKLHHDPNHAREMLLLATSNEDQHRWPIGALEQQAKHGSGGTAVGHPALERIAKAIATVMARPGRQPRASNPTITALY